MHLVDPGLPETTPNDQNKHADYSFSSKAGTEFKFIWDPFLNSSKENGHVNFTFPGEPKPFLLILGSGLWYLRYPETSGGLAQWELNIGYAIKSVSKRSPAKFNVVLPVEKVVPSKLSAERASSISTIDIELMNAELEKRLHSNPLKGNLIIYPSVFNDLLVPSQTNDGLHYGKEVTSAQANILLNRICNEFLPKAYPFDKTCCRSYPRLSHLQLAILVSVAFSGPIVLLARRSSSFSFLVKRGPNPLHAYHITVVGGCTGLLFLADRTHLFLKEQKEFDPILFSAALLFALAIGLWKLETGKDKSFLNRPQTDEWKGWMQVVILIYHYLGASKISGIYNLIRVLVASYLFMTGYGHCSFYLKKADYSFLRIAQVLIRLNLLTILLAYTMNTNYFDYYFAPMVSFWFLVIYCTMVCGTHHNDKAWFLVSKLLVSSLAIYTFINTPVLFENFLNFLHRYAGISWSPKEVHFRLSLDLWIVYFGMLAAILYHKSKEMKIPDQVYWRNAKAVGLTSSCLGLCWFMYFELTQPSKFTYNRWHPLISWIPILSFIILRNSTTSLRSTSSAMFAFIGTCSLETFIIQFHFWLAADTKGILLVLPGTTWRPINVIVTTVSFIWISHQVALSTVRLTDWICNIPKNPPNSSTQAVIELPQNTPSNPASTELPPESGRDHWANRLTASEDSAASSGGLKLSWHVDIRLRFAMIIFTLWLLNLSWSVL